MTVKVNGCFSDPLPVHGGCPQGSLLWVLIFNVSTDDIERSPGKLLDDTRDDFHSHSNCSSVV